MNTRQSIAPDIDRRRFHEAASHLESEGLIHPVRLGKGKPIVFTDQDARTIREFLDRPKVSGHYRPEPSESVLDRPDTFGHPELAGEAAPDPADELREQLAELKKRLDNESEARSQEKLEAQAQADALTAKLRDLDEERRNQRARISNLETTIKKGRPKSLWDRLKLALGVIIGDNAAIPALPESTSAGTDYKKAA